MSWVTRSVIANSAVRAAFDRLAPPNECDAALWESIIRTYMRSRQRTWRKTEGLLADKQSQSLREGLKGKTGQILSTGFSNVKTTPAALYAMCMDAGTRPEGVWTLVFILKTSKHLNADLKKWTKLQLDDIAGALRGQRMYESERERNKASQNEVVQRSDLNFSPTRSLINLI
jgi:hypothetical protein